MVDMDYQAIIGFIIGISGFLLYFCSLGPTYLARVFKKESQVMQIFFRTSGEIFLLVAIIWLALLDYKLVINVVSILGFLLFLISVIISLIGVRNLKITSVYMTMSDKLITKGIYTKIRHPQALARILMAFGVALLLNSQSLIWFSVLVVLPGFIIDTYIEDRELKLRFGQQFVGYENQVSRFLPYIW